jgi:Sulfotransferase family
MPELVRETSFGDRLIWILGSSRSGSTWLLRMLGDLSEVVPIDDPHLGHHLGVWRPIPLAWATAEGHPPDLSTLTEYQRHKPDFFFSDRYRDAWLPALRDLIETRFGAQVADVAGEHGIENPMTIVKEPASHVADLLMTMFPSSGMLWLLRDGRDVVDSWLDAYSHDSWALDEGAYALSARARMAFVRWQSSVWRHRTEIVQHTFEAHDPTRRILVRYEDLLRDPTHQLTRICRRFGLLAGEAKVRELAERHAFVRTSGEQRGSGKEKRFAEPGRWRRNLTEPERAAMHELMGDKLEELGYAEPLPVGADPER